MYLHSEYKMSTNTAYFVDSNGCTKAKLYDRQSVHILITLAQLCESICSIYMLNVFTNVKRKKLNAFNIYVECIY